MNGAIRSGAGAHRHLAVNRGLRRRAAPHTLEGETRSDILDLERGPSPPSGTLSGIVRGGGHANDRDRKRHAVLFELNALIIAAPLCGMMFGVPVGHFGVVAVVSTTIAILWNCQYILGFAHAMLRLHGDTRKTPAMRLAHGALFDAGPL